MAIPAEIDTQLLEKTAIRVAQEAAELARAMRAKAITQVDTKSTDTDMVTAADRAAEQLIRDRLAQLRPGEPVLGEEQGGPDLTASDLIWVVDPIDGTTNYLYGFPWYSVSVAVQWRGISIAGAVVEPDSGRVWSAAYGHGARMNGQSLHPSATKRLDLALIATGFAYLVDRRVRQAGVVAELIGKVRDIRRAGAASLDLCAVAAGWYDGYFEVNLQRWDWAAGALIAQEAGAVVHLPGDQHELGPDVLIAASPGIANALRAEILASGITRV